MYEAEGGCPAGGVVAEWGEFKESFASSSPTRDGKAGVVPITGKEPPKKARESRPNIYLWTVGVYLPMQDEIFLTKTFGRCSHNARFPLLESLKGGHGQLCCGCYLPIMSDEHHRIWFHLSCRKLLVKAAIGETIDNETLGGAATHDEISGVCGLPMQRMKDIGAHSDVGVPLGDFGNDAGFIADPANLLEISVCREITQSLRHVRSHLSLTDEDSFTEYKKGYGKTIVCGCPHRWLSVGLVANQRSLVKSKKTAAIRWVIYRQCRQGCSFYRHLQSAQCSLVSSGCNHSWSGPGQNMEASSRMGQNGQCRSQQRGSQIHHCRRKQLRCGQLRDVRRLATAVIVAWPPHAVMGVNKRPMCCCKSKGLPRQKGTRNRSSRGR